MKRLLIPAFALVLVLLLPASALAAHKATKAEQAKLLQPILARYGTSPCTFVRVRARISTYDPRNALVVPTKVRGNCGNGYFFLKRANARGSWRITFEGSDTPSCGNTRADRVYVDLFGTCLLNYGEVAETLSKDFDTATKAIVNRDGTVVDYELQGVALCARKSTSHPQRVDCTGALNATYVDSAGDEVTDTAFVVAGHFEAVNGAPAVVDRIYGDPTKYGTRFSNTEVIYPRPTGSVIGGGPVYVVPGTVEPAAQ